MKQSFKFCFKHLNNAECDDIRRIAVSVPPPSWPQFVSLLQNVYPRKFHPELSIQYKDDEGELVTVASQIEWEEALNVLENDRIIRIFITETEGPFFKDSPAPVPVKFYEESTQKTDDDSRVDIPEVILDQLKGGVPRALERLFPGGKILPFNIPDWLKGALKLVPIDGKIVDLDVDVDRLYRVLLDKALELLNQGLNSEGKEVLEALLLLNPTNPLTLYNLACAESLLGQIQESLAHLRLSIDHGYKNLDHMLHDSDLENLRYQPEFAAIVTTLKAKLGLLLQDQEVESEEDEEVEEVEDDEEELKPQMTEANTESESESESETEEDQDQEEEQPQKLEIELSKKYAEELQILKDMGFDDTDNNLALLVNSNGNMAEVIAILVEGFVHI